MITLREIADHSPALAYSPIVRGIKKTFAQIGEHGAAARLFMPSALARRIFR